MSRQAGSNKHAVAERRKWRVRVSRAALSNRP